MVAVKNGHVIADSLGVAERFGKNHSDVLKAIRNLNCSREFTLSNFTEPQLFDFASGSRASCGLIAAVEDKAP